MAGNTFANDRELAREAGRKGGKVKKYDEAWLRLGHKLTGDHAEHIRKYMNKLIREGRDDEFFENYLKLLQYFKPKVMAHAVKTQTEITFRFESGDKELFEDI